jgi:hypothetical protein
MAAHPKSRPPTRRLLGYAPREPLAVLWALLILCTFVARERIAEVMMRIRSPTPRE